MENKRKWLPLKAGFLERERMTRLYREGLDRSVITVVAGPGYGKTSSAAAFARNTDRRVAWLHLNRYNNDTGRFWEIFVRAIGQEMPNLAEELAKMSFPGSASTFESFLHLFSKEVYNGDQVVMIVDDYDCIVSAEIGAFFESLVEVGMENLCLIVLSANRTHMNAVGLKSLGGLYSITSEDLKCTDEEVRAYFRFHGVSFTEDDIRAVMEKTEGWPLSLSLLAMQYKNSVFDKNDMKTHMNLTADLFEREYYADMDEDLKALFIKLCLLPGFSLEMIREIGGCELTKATDVITRHMFIKYDHPARLYVFQNMYREFLAQMSYVLEKDEVNRVFSVAGEWFMEHGLSVKALSCFMECKRYDRVLEAVRQLPKRRLGRDLATYVLQCLYELPPDFARQHVFVEFSAGIMMLNNLDITRAHDMISRVVQRLEQSGDDTGSRQLLGEAYTVLADIRLLQNADGFDEYYQKACGYIDHSWLRGRETIFLGNNSAFFLLGNGPGSLELTLEKVVTCFEYAERVTGGVGYGYEMLFQAEAAFYTGDHEKTLEYSYSAIYKAKVRDQYDIVCNAYFLLIRCNVYTGNYLGARKWLDQIRACVDDRGAPELLELRDCAELWYYNIMKDLEKIPEWIKEHDSSALSRFPVGNGRNRSMYPQYLMGRGKYREANAVMRNMELLFRQKGLWTLRLTTYAMRAVCDMQLGDMGSALDNFHSAYDMAWQNSIVLPFVEFGNLMRTLVSNARRSEKYRFDEGWLDSVYTKATAYAKRHAALVSEYCRDNRIRQAAGPGAKLTKRELEILGFLAKGMNREEIGQFLGISVNGVKKHITGIYNKLGAVNRADAIRLAAIRDEINIG